MITSCSQCTQDVYDDAISQCSECEEDGLCPDCLRDHDCYVDDDFEDEYDLDEEEED